MSATHGLLGILLVGEDAGTLGAEAYQQRKGEDERGHAEVLHPLLPDVDVKLGNEQDANEHEDVVAHLGVVDKGDGHREGRQQRAQPVALLVDEVEAAYNDGHQRDGGRFGDVPCRDDDKEIRRQSDGQRSHDAEPLVHLERPEQDEETDEIDHQDGRRGALLMAGQRNLLQRLEQGGRLVVSSAYLVVGHTAEHAARPEAVVARLVVVLLHLLHGSLEVAGVACVDDLTLQRGGTVDAGDGCEDDDGRDVGAETVQKLHSNSDLRLLACKDRVSRAKKQIIFDFFRGDPYLKASEGGLKIG